RISSISATPRCLSSSLARTQYGHTWVVYIFTFAIVTTSDRERFQADFSTGRLASRHAARPPSSARQFSYLFLRRILTARYALAPVVHSTTSGKALFFGRSAE